MSTSTRQRLFKSIFLDDAHQVYAHPSTTFQRKLGASPSAFKCQAKPE